MWGKNRCGALGTNQKHDVFFPLRVSHSRTTLDRLLIYELYSYCRYRCQLQ